MEISEMTDIGFKRKVNQLYKKSDGYEREFVKCKKCGERAYYDFVPYSLSNPIQTTPCGHDIKYHYTSF